MQKRKIKKKWLIMMIVLSCILLTILACTILRRLTHYPARLKAITNPTCYTNEEKALNGIALSYFCYGSEHSDLKEGTVSDMLDNNQMGIIIENFGVKRTKADDPGSALIDTAAFIRSFIGDYRFLADLQDEKSGFYGMAVADDLHHCVWVAFSGAVDTADMMSCAAFYFVPGLSRQERFAADFMETICGLDEITTNHYSLILTGHSLGGALATEIALIGSYDAVTINGADGMAVSKARSIIGNRVNAKQITNYLTSPKNGKTSFLDFVQRLMFVSDYQEVDLHIYSENGLTNEPHCAFSFIGKDEDTYYLREEIGNAS